MINSRDTKIVNRAFAIGFAIFIITCLVAGVIGLLVAQ